MSLNRKLLKRQPLHEEISQYIKEAILTGELKPGDRIVETRLAQGLGVSQAPVREAIRELEFSGLVIQKPYSGTYVKQITATEMQQYYEVRGALERLGAHKAMENMTPEQYKVLSETIDAMEEAAREKRMGDYIKCDALFHDQIIEIADNELLSRLWAMCGIRSWLYIGTTLTGRDLTELAGRHREILRMLRAEDADALEAAVANHLNDLLDMMEENKLKALSAEED